MGKNNPFFSVIIPTHNRPEFLPKAVKSVLTQKFQDFEIIVVNDASSVDYSKAEEFLKEDERIRYYKVEYKNRSKTRNLGIDKAKGDWICFLDDDDIYYDNHLEVLHRKIINKPDINIFYTNSIVTLKNKEIRRTNGGKTLNTPNLIANTFLPIHTLTINKSILTKEKFRDDMEYQEDTELWMRLSSLYPFYPINDFTCEYIIHGNNTVSLSDLRTLKSKLNSINILQKEYRNLDKKWINNRQYNIYIGLCNLYFDKKNVISFKYFIKAILINPNLLFTRWTLGKIKRLIIN